MEHICYFLLLTLACSSMATNTDVALCTYHNSNNEMDCSNLNIRKMKGKTFPLNKTETTSVNLKNTNLKELPFDTFFCLSNLRYLNLAQNKLQDFNERVFSFVKSLIELNLSENRFSNLSGRLFYDLTELRKLYLESNMITYLNDENVFKSQGKLYFLSLKNNQITTIKAEVLKPLSSLNKLELSRNPLSCDCELRISMLWCLQRCIFTHAICQLPQVYNGKPWTEILNNTCSYPENRLHDLDIKNNTENTIQCNEEKCFFDTKDISMDCEDVNLYEVNADKYPLTNDKLRSISLRNTRLKQIGSNSFDKFSELYELDLGENSLETIQSTLFSELRNLKWLYLDSNKLVSLNDRAIFASLSNLEALTLSFNKLTYISVDVLTPLVSLSYLSLEGNRFVCNCLLRPTALWCENNNIAKSAKCYSPKELSGSSWDIFRNTTGDCSLQETGNTTLIIIAILFGLLLASCFIITFWFLWKRKRLSGTVNDTMLTYDDVRQVDYFYETIDEAQGKTISSVPRNELPNPPNITKLTQITTGLSDTNQIYNDVGDGAYSESSIYILPDNREHKK